MKKIKKRRNEKKRKEEQKKEKKKRREKKGGKKGKEASKGYSPRRAENWNLLKRNDERNRNEMRPKKIRF